MFQDCFLLRPYLRSEKFQGLVQPWPILFVLILRLFIQITPIQLMLLVNWCNVAALFVNWKVLLHDPESREDTSLHLQPKRIRYGAFCTVVQLVSSAISTALIRDRSSLIWFVFVLLILSYLDSLATIGQIHPNTKTKLRRTYLSFVAIVGICLAASMAFQFNTVITSDDWPSVLALLHFVRVVGLILTFFIHFSWS